MERPKASDSFYTLFGMGGGINFITARTKEAPTKPLNMNTVADIVVTQ